MKLNKYEVQSLKLKIKAPVNGAFLFDKWQPNQLRFT